jgi:hypothetical protein
MKFIFKYSSPLELNECQRRLSELVRNDVLFSTTPGPAAKGWIVGHWFYLWSRRYVGDQILVEKNNHVRVCIGRFRSKQGKTIVQGYTGIHPLILLFIITWFGSMLAFGVLGLIFNSLGAIFILIPVMIIAIIFGLIWVVLLKSLSEDAQIDLNQFIRTTFNVDGSQ